MTISIATRLLTAFATFTALEAACKSGYVPTLRVAKSDSSHERKAKIILTNVLTANGYKVFGV
jgi:hypothetical protein